MQLKTSDKVRFALIGCGAIANKHVTALTRLEEAQVVGCYDVHAPTGQKFAAKHGIPFYPDLDELVRRGEPDFFNILTPSGCHAQSVLDLARYNRHFVVEKPLALQLSDVDRILAECAHRELRVYVVKQNRFNPPLFRLKQAIDGGRFGRMVLGTVRLRWTRDQAYYDQGAWRGTWAYDGGVLANQASHHLDALLWLMGDADSVHARIATRLVNIEAEDTAVATISFASGALGIIEATTATRPKDLEGAISVLGEHGAVEIGGFFMNQLKTWEFSEPDAMDEDVWSQHATVPGIPAWNHSEFFRDVIASYRAGRKGLVDGLEGRRSVELITALYESAERGETVNLRFRPRVCRLGQTGGEQPRARLQVRRAA